MPPSSSGGVGARLTGSRPPSQPFSPIRTAVLAVVLCLLLGVSAISMRRSHLVDVVHVHGPRHPPPPRRSQQEAATRDAQRRGDTSSAAEAEEGTRRPAQTPAQQHPEDPVNLGDPAAAQLLPPLDMQLFVVWHGAMDKRSTILRDIASKFVVLDVHHVHWPDYSTVFEENLWRVYSGKGGWRRVGMSVKARQCGRGDFVVVVVGDMHPDYRLEHTAHGQDNVSHNMNEAKQRYRKLSGGGFRVHGTFNPTEAMHDTALLTGYSPQQILRLRVSAVVQSSSNGDASADSTSMVSQLQRAGRRLVEDYLSSQTAAGGGGGGPQLLLNWPVYTLGYRGEWESCDQLELALSTYRVRWEETAVEDLEGGGGVHKKLSVKSCAEWPVDVSATVSVADRWAMVAALGGVENDDPAAAVNTKRKRVGGAADDANAPDPSEFRIAVAGRGHRIRVKAVKGFFVPS